MRARSLLILLAVIAFLGVLVARLPLKWATRLLPGNVSCAQPSGSLWQGRCGALAVQNGAAGPMPLGTVSWTLAPAALLRTHAAGVVRFEGPQLLGSATVDASLARDLHLSDVELAAPLDRRLLGMVPANWTGRLQLRIAALSVRGGQLETLRGTLEAHDIVAQGPRPDEFGSYSLTFADPPSGAAGGIHRGALKDLGGPLEVDGTLEVRDNFAWELDAGIKARASATSQLARLIEVLGPPDAQGRRRFSAAGDF
jgi:hypothetical protein